MLVEARSRGRGKKAGNARKVDRPMRQGRDKGERVWHVAASEEECGDVNTTFHQSHEKPHDLCTEVSQVISGACQMLM